MKKEQGFTIIELIVVIAIIAVLAGIILVNVTQYINKSKDAAIKGNLSTVMTNAVVYFDGTPAGTGTTFLATSGYLVPEAAILAANGNSTLSKFGGTTDQSWCACSKVLGTSGNTFCVDSTGYKKETATACATRCATGSSLVHCID